MLFEILFLLMFWLELPEIYILTSPFLHISKSCFFGPIASVRTNIGPGPHMCTIGEIFFRKIKFDIQLNSLEKNRVQNFSEIVPKMVDQKSASANFTIKKSVTSCNSCSPWCCLILRVLRALLSRALIVVLFFADFQAVHIIIK